MQIRTTLSSPNGTSHIPEQATAAHRTMSARLAELDFSDAQALALFPAETFDGVDPEGVGRALASRILDHFAGQHQQTLEWIEPGRDTALETLIAHLTPMGQEALLQSLESDQGDTAFSKCFALADRYRLAGHLHRQRAESHLSAGGCDTTPQEARAQAAADDQKAADYFLNAAEIARAEADARPGKGKYAQAGADYQRAAKVYAELGQPGPQALAWRWAARMYIRAQQPGLALIAFEHSALANGQAGRHGAAGDDWRRCADILIESGTAEQVRDAFKNAATDYQRAAESAPTILQGPSHAPDDPEGHYALPAFSYRLLEADYYRAAGWLEKSYDAFVKAAETLMAEDLPLAASDAIGLGEQYADKTAASTRLEPRDVADALRQIGLALGPVHEARMARLLPGDEADAIDKKAEAEMAKIFLSAAKRYEEIGAFKEAAEACVEAGDLVKAADLFARAGEYDLAGFCHEEMKEFELAAKFYKVASAQVTDELERARLIQMAQECLSGQISSPPDSV